MSTRANSLLFLGCLFSASLLSVSALAQSASDSTARILDQLTSTRHVSSVALSPDAKTVAAVLGGILTIKKTDAAPDSHGIPIRACVAGAGTVKALAWSPDNSRLAALVQCENGTHLLEIPAQSPTSPRSVATLTGYAESLSWSPNGKSLALLYVEGDSHALSASSAQSPRLGVIGIDGLESKRVALIDSTTGVVRQVTPANLHVFEYAFSPDSTHLAYTAAPPPGENNWWVARLYTQAVHSGSTPVSILDPQTVTGPLHNLQIADPVWSPDGSRIALIGGLMSDQGTTGGDLYILPAKGTTAPVDYTAGSHMSLAWIHWLPNQHLLGVETRGGLQQLDELTPDTNALAEDNVLLHWTANISLDASSDPQLSADGKIAAWAGSSFSTPPELYVGPLNGKMPPALTELNASLKPLWGPSESIEWTNEGYSMQGWLHYPADYDPAKHYGLIVMPHGGPAYSITPEWPSAAFGSMPLSGAGYFVLQPNPRGSFGQDEAFTRANHRDLGFGDLRDILAGVDAVEKKLPAIDDRRLGISGWSYGGFMTMFAITQTHRFHAAVAGAGISDWLSYYGENQIDQWMLPYFGGTVYSDPAIYARSSPIQYVKNVTTPTLFLVGELDGECPAPQSFEMWHALHSLNVPTTLVVYPGEGHDFVDMAHRLDVIIRPIQWFNQYLK